MKEWYIKLKLKQELKRVFEKADIHYTYSSSGNKQLIYPKIHDIAFDNKEIRYVFTIPIGVDPDIIQKKWYVFQQTFGKNVRIEGDVKKFVLVVSSENNKLKPFKYKYDNIQPLLIPYRLPILVGKDEDGNFIVYDMTEETHLLIAGETGAGKSSVVRSILCTLIQYLDVTELEIYLADLKMQEFHIFRRVQHVKEICTDETELLVMLTKLMTEIKRRQKLTSSLDVENIWEYNAISKEQLPYLLICIDEFAEVQDDQKVRRLVERISSIGRSAGVFLISSTQRPDKDAVPGKLKINLTVRMGLKVPDTTNSKIIGTPGAESIDQKGQMILRLKGLRKIQAPYLELKDAKKILEKYKVVEQPKQEQLELQNNIFGVLDDENEG